MNPPIPVTPRPAATVMLLRDRRTVEVLLLRRSTDTPFVPGAHVFPGGAVEDHDDDPAYDPVTDLSDATASAVLGVPSGGRAYWVAAIRECLEEAGVLVAKGDGRAIDDRHPALRDETDLRHALEADRTTLLDLCRTHDVLLPLSELAYISQWITPAESPRRYDTRFFAAAMPEGQRASADQWEAVDANWWSPSAALDSWQAGEIQLIEPTVASLRLLVGHESVDAAMGVFLGSEPAR